MRESSAAPMRATAWVTEVAGAPREKAAVLAQRSTSAASAWSEETSRASESRPKSPPATSRSMAMATAG